MSKRCELTGVSPLKGHNVSHSNNKTKRRFLPNLKKVTFQSDKLKKNITLREQKSTSAYFQNQDQTIFLNKTINFKINKLIYYSVSNLTKLLFLLNFHNI